MSDYSFITDDFDNMTPEEQNAILKKEVIDLRNTLERCINIVNNLQEIVFSNIRSIDCIYFCLEKHIKDTHAMLIIGNKEKKNENDIS